MKTSIDLDSQTATELEETAALVREKPATVIRLALRAGLPMVKSRFQAPRPEGYFADAYRAYPKERSDLEAAFARVKTRPDR